MKKSLLSAVAVVVMMAGGLAIVGHNLPSAVATSNNAVFGVNMALFDGNEQIVTNAGTRSILAGWHTPTIRMPFRSGLSDAVELSALNAIKVIGAAPLVIVHGAVDGAALSDDTHLLGLVQQVFGPSLVYVEYGNEEDLAGIDAVAYTTSWNAVVPSLKALHPTYDFIGPVNFQQNPAYIGYFVAHARPLPDVVSWHEYVCGPGDATSICMTHIANWSTHVTNTNAAEVAAIGHTIPFMITEWNMDPQNDSRYLDPNVIGPWTTSAAKELESLVPAGLIGAQLYAAASHGGGFELIDSSNALTPAGTAFQAALRAAGGPPPTTTLPPTTTTLPHTTTTVHQTTTTVHQTTTTVHQTTTTVPPTTTTPPTTVPSTTVAPTTTTTPPKGSVRFDFEDATTQGWSGAWGPVTVSNTGTVAFTGTHSLAVSTSGGYPAIQVGVNGLTSGASVTYHLYSATGNVNVIPFATDGNWHNAFVGTTTLSAGWNTVTWSVPSLSSVSDIGLQVNTTTGTVNLDTVSW